MKKIMIRNAIIPVVLMMVLGLCSCASKNEDSNNYWYYSVSTVIQSKENYQSYVKKLFAADDNYYVVVGHSKVDKNFEDSYSEIFKIRPNGEVDSEYVIPSEIDSGFCSSVYDDKYYSVDYDNVLHVFNLNNGQTEYDKPLFVGNCRGIYSIEDGLVILAEDEIDLYSFEGEELTKIQTGNININSLSNAFFMENGKYYVAGGRVDAPTYYEVDFENKAISKLFSSDSSVGASYSGDMAFTSTGIYSVDVENKWMVPITKWNYCDVKPAIGSAIETNYALGENIFAKVYTYPNGDIELLTFQKYDSNENNSRKILTIGGYGVSNSESVKWAVYNYNRNQTEYRIFIDEYNEKYAYSDAQEAQSSLLKLIQYFNEGNAPDIFYGFGFDYRYFYKSGMVIDMYPMIQADKDFSFDGISDSVANTYMDDGVCYQVYPGYTFNGEFGLKENFGSEDIVTSQSIQELAKSKGIPVDLHSYAIDYVDTIIRYSFDDVMSKNLTEEQLKEIIAYAKKNESTVSVGDDWERAVAEGKCLTFMSFVNGLYDVKGIEEGMHKSITYLGRPSIYGTKHTVDPDGLVAISSGSQYPSACWDFIKCMFDDDVQKIIASQGFTPVNKKIINEYLEYAKNPSMVGDDYIMRNAFYGKDAVPEWIIEDYLGMVNSVDSVVTYDWGIFNIISDEVNAYVLGNKSIDDVSKSLKSRLTIYWSENYFG